MPELPEVETVIRMIRPKLIERKILRTRFTVSRQLAPLTPRQMMSRLKGRMIQAVKRQGKFILVELDRGVLVIHLRMTGRLFVRKAGHAELRHERAFFELDDGQELVFSDSRTLGTIQVYKSAEEVPALRAMGVDPLHEAMDEARLKELLQKRTIEIKPLLLNQTIWAGLGNIYASEILWEAEIHPRKRSNQLSASQREQLTKAVPLVIRRALEKGGSTLRDFMSPEGTSGSYQKEFRVYGREGDACLRCGKPIMRIVQAQRSTYYCAGCQKKR